MYKFLLSAAAAASANALSIATLESHADDFSTPIDESASTKLVGIFGWQYFYDLYVDSLHSSNDDLPASYAEGRHLCYFRFVVEQPYSAAGDSRTSIAVTHNCPAELIESIDFSITFSNTEGAYTIVDDDKSRDSDGYLVDLTKTSFDCGSLLAKTEAGSGDSSDCGVWHPAASDALVWSYSYVVNVADLFAESEPVTEEPVVDPTGPIEEPVVDPTGPV